MTGEYKDKRKASKGSKAAATFGQAQFVNYELTQEQARKLKSTAFTLEDVEASLTELCEADYKVTVSWDDYSEAFAAFLIPKRPDDPNSGLILTGRGSTPVKAIKQLLFKHGTCLGGDWRSVSRPRVQELDD